jgi:hypothetical protein
MRWTNVGLTLVEGSCSQMERLRSTWREDKRLDGMVRNVESQSVSTSVSIGDPCSPAVRRWSSVVGLDDAFLTNQLVGCRPTTKSNDAAS